jgi:hypothetical protein
MGRQTGQQGGVRLDKTADFPYRAGQFYGLQTGVGGHANC